jgi:tetratricopeptide (TPR) repeat protein
MNGKLLGLITLGLLVAATVATARHEFERLGANRMLYIAETQAGVLASQGPQQRQIAARNLAGLQRAHKASPADPRIPHAIGSYYLLLDQLGQSEIWYRRALELEPRAETYLNLARVLERRNERAEAAEQYRTAARLSPALRREVPGWVGE